MPTTAQEIQFILVSKTYNCFGLDQIDHINRYHMCNFLLYGVSKYNVAKLQKIQNALCRIVFTLDRTSHVTAFLQKLHWLPISYHILFKINFQGH